MIHKIANFILSKKFVSCETAVCEKKMFLIFCLAMSSEFLV